ncbi:MAG: TauD/TfdA family dioxygenase [Flavobacteriales bacterium]|nr:TauD/TfdA family dioxygenase [Flavobacteriales bacterium]
MENREDFLMGAYFWENFSENLRKKGYQIIGGKPSWILNEILEELGPVIQITEVIVKPESKALVTSDRALDFHTDHHRARYIVWHCHKASTEGGDTLLVDAWRVWEKMSRSIREELRNIRLFEHKVFQDDEESYPLVSEDRHGCLRFYYSFWLVNKEDLRKDSVRSWMNAIKEEKPIQMKLKEGDILVIDNHRILHARTAITGSKDRHLTRYWIAEKTSIPFLDVLCKRINFKLTQI